MTELDPKTLLEGNKIFAEFKGALTEQFVCQQIFAELNATPFYWSADNSTGELDFVLQYNGNILPLEVKAEENLNAKSLRSFISSNNLHIGFRSSMSDYKLQENMVNIPLYCISQLLDISNKVII